MSAMSTVPITPLEETTLIPLAEVDTQMLVAFADELAAVPRYFGNGAIPRPSARWRSLLCHPAAVSGHAAVVDGELVGVARLTSRAAGGANLYLAVATPWRRMGVGALLVQASVTLAAHQGLVPVVAVTEHHKAPVRALSERFAVPVADPAACVRASERLAS